MRCSISHTICKFHPIYFCETLKLKKNPKGEYPTITVSVESIDEHIKKVESVGGKQTMPKMNIGGHGFYTRVSDMEGNVIGLWKSPKQ